MYYSRNSSLIVVVAERLIQGIRNLLRKPVFEKKWQLDQCTTRNNRTIYY